MIEAVLFDGDQTLWDFEKVMHGALLAVLEELRPERPVRPPTRRPGRTSKRTGPTSPPN